MVLNCFGDPPHAPCQIPFRRGTCPRPLASTASFVSLGSGCRCSSGRQPRGEGTNRRKLIGCAIGYFGIYFKAPASGALPCNMLDIVVFGATGDVGRVVCSYLFSRGKLAGVTSWAPAGRNLKKIAATLGELTSSPYELCRQ